MGLQGKQKMSRQGFSLYIIAAIIVFLVGVVYIYKYYNGTLEKLYTKTYCDKESQVQYIIYSDGFSSGMSVKYNKDGQPMRCETTMLPIKVQSNSTNFISRNKK